MSTVFLNNQQKYTAKKYRGGGMIQGQKTRLVKNQLCSTRFLIFFVPPYLYQQRKQ